MEWNEIVLKRFLLVFALIAASTPTLFPTSINGQTQPKGIDPALMAKAKAGDAKSQLLVGFAYGKGDGVPTDLTQAAAWYRKAAENGDATAQFVLAWENYEGLGVPKDIGQADTWFRKAGAHAELIDLALAREYPFFSLMAPLLKSDEITVRFFYLGSLYEDGKDLPQDFSQAAFWFRRGAELGDAEAQSILGVLYAEGKGVPQDYAQAAAWDRKAAEQGDIDAQFNLGTLYVQGRGVPQDYKQAVEWLTKAAVQGEPHAQYNLAVMYWRGNGVPENDPVAYLWFDLAAARLNGPDRENAEKGRDACAKQLTPEVLSKAQEVASKWFAEHPAKQ
jgi:TPR repeat protein